MFLARTTQSTIARVRIYIYIYKCAVLGAYAKLAGTLSLVLRALARIIVELCFTLTRYAAPNGLPISSKKSIATSPNLQSLAARANAGPEADTLCSNDREQLFVRVRNWLTLSPAPPRAGPGLGLLAGASPQERPLGFRQVLHMSS